MCRQLAKARDLVETQTAAKLEAVEQLRHAERLSMVGRISSGIAHEMGTPLNVVAGRAKMIADSRLDPEEIATGTRIIREQVDRMAKIIRQLLDFSRRRQGQHRPEDMEKLAANVLEILKPTAQKAGVALELSTRGDLPTIVIDRFEIEQALMNLTMNGIQAMPQGGVLRIELDLTQGRHHSNQKGINGDYLVVKVVDDGIGIPDSNRDQVFEPFFTTKKVGQGTGLGMSIVKGIVEEHKGWLELESEPGHGTTVSVFLPLEAET
jgi:signal transduction histidine kinase